MKEPRKTKICLGRLPPYQIFPGRFRTFKNKKINNLKLVIVLYSLKTASVSYCQSEQKPYSSTLL